MCQILSLFKLVASIFTVCSVWWLRTRLKKARKSKTEYTTTCTPISVDTSKELKKLKIYDMFVAGCKMHLNYNIEFLETIV